MTPQPATNRFPQGKRRFRALSGGAAVVILLAMTGRDRTAL